MIVTPLCQRIFVRYARKPIWFPTAKSKLFRIAEHNFYSPEESEQIKVLHAAYVAQEKSIQEFMRKEFFIPASQSGGLPADFINRELEKDKKLFEENDRVNAEIGKLKQEYINKNLTEIEQRLYEEKRLIEDRLTEDGQKVDEYVVKLKSDPDAFVTPQNIDSMIEKAIAEPVSFEFFIDMSGRRYTGHKLSESKQPTNSNDK